MAEYLILINEDESSYATATPDVLQQVMEAHNRFAKQVEETGGSIVSGRALQPTSTATSIRDDVVTDGPFAETKEQLAGFYMVEARDLNEAIQVAARIPPARVGSIEVRPIRPIRETVAAEQARQKR